MRNTYLLFLIVLAGIFGIYRIYSDETAASYELHKNFRQNSIQEGLFDYQDEFFAVGSQDSEEPVSISDSQKSDSNEINFLVLGDFGYLDDDDDEPNSEQQILSNLISSRVLDSTTNYDFIVSVGDNFYPYGLISERDNKPKILLEDTFQMSKLGLNWYSVLGNHDLIGDLAAVLNLNRRYPLWKQTEPYYYKIENIGKSHLKAGFIYMNSCDLVCTKRTNPECFGHMWKNVKFNEIDKQIKWLDNVLSSMSNDNDITWKIVVIHNAIFSAGQRHGDNQHLIEMVLPLLHKYKVDLMLSGHDHSVQYLRMDRNLYKPNAKQGNNIKQNTVGCSVPPNTKYCSEDEFFNEQLDKCGKVQTIKSIGQYSRESVVAQGEYMHQFVFGNGGTKHEKLCPVKQMTSLGNLRYGHSVSGIGDIKVTEDQISIKLLSVDNELLYSIQILKESAE